jgi:hypothetical protein
MHHSAEPAFATTHIQRASEAAAPNALEHRRVEHVLPSKIT